MSSRHTESTSSNGNGSTNAGNKESGSFECNICLELAQDPIVTLCGHLFCWPCLYEWLHMHAHSPECPVCKALVEEDKLVPLYGRGKTRTDPRTRSSIPSRPTGQRPATAPQPDPNQFHGNPNPWFMGGQGTGGPTGAVGPGGPGGPGGPVGRWGNYTFSAAIGGLFPLLSFQVHGFPHAAAYGPSAGFPYGYGHSFHGWHAHGIPRQGGGAGGAHNQGQQADVYLKALLILVGVLVIASLIAF
ncbi:RING finger protein [Rhynchospora pubera]|uniref:E3 ubiquitin-protein ligase RMA n=1 Tax=Rhynchospora pubera TaxID=906938 RepID=A0AAV8CHC5_9POAL|nr:RING finger protein [Rhynchospora pubera]KAJ4792396.1 RING finger protein [Rhynchospora pubera]